MTPRLVIPLSDVIAVIAIFHTGRDPAIWQRRVNSRGHD